MTVRLPNLELIEYKATLYIKKENPSLRPEFDIITFPQIWGSTCGGNDITTGGEPAIAGCAMTKEYTTVVHELNFDLYFVFFGNNPCYLVENANENFLSDLKNRTIVAHSIAKERY
jgi:hypothetical protein|nr:MAG TPA: hypothetical protein [Caudoviricetes sp.]